MQLFRHSWIFLCYLVLSLPVSARPANNGPTVAPPLASFVAQTLCERDSVVFVNQSTMGMQMVYSWDFGDSTVSIETNPSHLYPATGLVANYNVTLIATDTTTGIADTTSMFITTFPQAFGYITRNAPYSGDTLSVNGPLGFNSNVSGTITTPATTYNWDFNDGQTSSLPNPDSIYILGSATRIVDLTILNGTCSFDTSDTFFISFEPIFEGGAYAGGASGEVGSSCLLPDIYAGGPSDGADRGDFSLCMDDSVFAGGPYDGAGRGDFKACEVDSVYAGGPFDGADRGDFKACEVDSVYAGGPFDGADRGDFKACVLDSVYAGGPFDGADRGEFKACGVDSVYAGGPFDGADRGDFKGCIADSIFAGGPFDGADMADEGIIIEVVQGNDSLCLGDSITLAGVLTNGSMASSWLWSTGDTTDTITIAPLASGWYSVTATLSNLCGPKTSEIYLHVNDPIPVDAGPDFVICDTQSVQLGTPMVPGYSYLWTPSFSLNDSSLAQPIASPPTTSSYILSVSPTEYVCPARMDTVTVSIESLVGLHYRSRRNGIWTDVTMWQVYDTLAMNWVDAELFGICDTVPFPTSVSLTIEVGHDVAYDYSIPIGVDQVNILSVGHLTIPDTVSLFLMDGPGSDFPLGANGRDIDNRGYFEITGTFDVNPGATLINDNLSIVHYNGGLQSMWNGYYGWLYVDGPGPIGNNTKTLGGPNTYLRTGLNFINAKIDLGNQNLELHADATVLNPGQNSGYMIATANGFCVWNYNTGLLQTHQFPLGGTIYSPATITFDTVTSAGNLLGRVREMQHPTRFTIFRYWTMELGSMNFNGFYDGTFQYDHADLPTVPVTLADELAQVVIGGAYNPVYTAPNGWRLSPVDLTNTLDLNANTGTIRNDAFSDFTFMPPLTLLSADLLTFDGRWEGKDGYLYWRSENEGNLEGYVLERSLDGWAFDSLTFNSPLGGVGPTSHYSYLDEELQMLEENTFYYRLRMVDLDGRNTYSNIATLTRERLSEEEYLEIFPNPSHLGEAFNIHYYLTEDRETEIVLYDVLGKLVQRRTESFKTGLNRIQIPTDDLSAGTYYINITNENGVKNRKVVVIR